MKLLLALGALLTLSWLPESINGLEATTTDAGTIIDGEPTNETRKVRPPKGSKTNVRCTGRSGKIEVSTSNAFGDSETISVSLASVTEVGRAKKSGKPSEDSDEEEEFKGGRHKFSTFANQNFEFTPLEENVTYPGSSLMVDRFSFSTEMKKRLRGKLFSMGNVTFTVFVFRENGTVELANTSSSVYAGSVKFNVEVSKYAFCEGDNQGCGGKSGSAIDIAIEIKGKGGKKPRKAKKIKGESDEVFSLGDKEALRTNALINVDGEWQNMTRGFPKMVERGSKNLFICRFRKFKDKVVYDPILDTNLPELTLADDDTDDDKDDEDDNTKDGDGNGGTAKISSSVVFLFCLALVKNLWE